MLGNADAPALRTSPLTRCVLERALNPHLPTVPSSSDFSFGDPPSERVSIEDVKRAAEQLRSKNESITLRAVRGVLGRGSYSTIQSHIKELRTGTQAGTSSASPVLSKKISDAIASELEAATKERTQTIFLELEEARVSIDLVVQENDALKTEAREISTQLASMKASLAHKVGVADSLQNQVESHQAELHTSRAKLVTTSQELLLVQERLALAHSRNRELEEELAVSNQRTEALRADVYAIREDREVIRREATVLEERLKAALTAGAHLEDATHAARELQSRLSETTNQLAALAAERIVQQERVDETQRALARSESTVERLIERLLDESDERERSASRASLAREGAEPSRRARSDAKEK